MSKEDRELAKDVVHLSKRYFELVDHYRKQAAELGSIKEQAAREAGRNSGLVSAIKVATEQRDSAVRVLFNLSRKLDIEAFPLSIPSDFDRLERVLLEQVNLFGEKGESCRSIPETALSNSPVQNAADAEAIGNPPGIR